METGIKGSGSLCVRFLPPAVIQRLLCNSCAGHPAHSARTQVSPESIIIPGSRSYLISPLRSPQRRSCRRSWFPSAALLPNRTVRSPLNSGLHTEERICIKQAHTHLAPPTHSKAPRAPGEGGLIKGGVRGSAG